MSDHDLAIRARLPSAARSAIGTLLESAREQHVADRLRDEDATLWGPAGTPEIANRLGWLRIAERMLDELLQIERFADGVRQDGLDDVVLLGMGGSSLAPEVFRRAFPSAAAGPRLHVLDTTDAARIAAVDAAIDPARTLFIVSSKSGGTIEPLSLFAHFYSLREDGANFAAITDPGSGLGELATERQFRHVFYGDPDIGGRYSALSPFGIVPATLIGIDTAALLREAPAAWEVGAEDSDAAWPARRGLARRGAGGAGARRPRQADLRDRPVAARPRPVARAAGGRVDRQARDGHPAGRRRAARSPPTNTARTACSCTCPIPARPTPTPRTRLTALAEAGHPVITIPTAGPGDLGRIFLLAELAVAVAGWGLEINPFDQPNVQQAKDATNRVLEGFEQSGALPVIEAAGEPELRELLLGAAPPDYVALMAYLQPSEEFDAAAAELREAIRAATRATTTFGYGPRFLHSTGQFHKGGPKTGRFLQLLHDGPDDVTIPGRPYAFTVLKKAQAIGDCQTLRELGLPAERVRLAGDDPVGALRALTATIKEWT